MDLLICVVSSVDLESETERRRSTERRVSCCLLHCEEAFEREEKAVVADGFATEGEKTRKSRSDRKRKGSPLEAFLPIFLLNASPFKSESIRIHSQTSIVIHTYSSIPIHSYIGRFVCPPCDIYISPSQAPASLTTPQLISVIHSISLHSLVSSEVDASLVSSYIRHLDVRVVACLDGRKDSRLFIRREES